MGRKIIAKMDAIIHTIAFCKELGFHVFHNMSLKGLIFCHFSGIIQNLDGLIVLNWLVVYYRY